jgi:Raf kinase inhibitor-like YbhB/YbcL family protein
MRQSKLVTTLIAISLLLVILTGCNSQTQAPASDPTPSPTTPTTGSEPFKLTSQAFKDGEAIPQRHWNLFCDKENISPELSWSGAPTGTKAFALIVDDPDPAPILHWVVYGMDTTTSGLPEGAQETTTVIYGASGRGGTGWWGPCPRAGRPAHNYIFTLYALSDQVMLPEGATNIQLLEAIEGKVIGTAVLTGTAKQ